MILSDTVTMSIFVYLIISASYSQLNLTCPHHIGCLSPAFFDEFTEFQNTYTRDDLNIATMMFDNTYGICVEPHLSDAIGSCPAPTIELMLNGVIVVENRFGEAAARELYLKILQVRDQYAFWDSQVAQSVARHRVDAIGTYDYLFGLSVPPAGYPLSPRHNVKIFVYSYPEALARVLVPSPIGCSAGQWGTEVLMHKWLTAPGNPYYTEDPDEADLFYVPVYGTCNIVRNNLTWSETWTEVYKPLIQFLGSFQSEADVNYWRRFNGRDHVFLFADGQGVNTFPEYAVVQSSILLMTESTCPTWGEPLENLTDIKSCFSPFKDIVIPGHTDFARVNQMRAQASDGFRDLLFSWRGRSVFIDETYSDAYTRKQIVENFLDQPGIDVGGFTKTFLEIKVRSKFCLVPAGTSPWTNHLYESLIAGCVPVIMSDEFELPFWHRIPWTELSIKWPENIADHRLSDYLASFASNGPLNDMLSKVAATSCWVDWWSKDAECNPYLAILDQLSDRSNTLKRSPRTWNVPPNIQDKAPRKARYHAKRTHYDWLKDGHY